MSDLTDLDKASRRGGERLGAGARPARRIRAAHAARPAHRHLAAAVARAVGALDLGRRPSGRAHLRHLPAGHVRDARGRLRHQRFRRPRIRSARPAHGQSPAGARRGVAGRGAGGVRRARPDRARAADPAQSPDAGARAGRRRAGRHLPVPEAVLRAAAGVPGPRLLVVHADGVRRADRRVAARSRGCCSSRACCGPRPTTRSTPWSIARTTSSSASAPRRSCSGAPIAASLQGCRRARCCCWRWPG